MSITDSHFYRPSHQYKKAYAYMYLPLTSFNPSHCTRNMPYSQCLDRIRRICSEHSMFQKRRQGLKGRLAKRGYYPLSLIDSTITKVMAISHTNSQYHSKRQTTDRTPLVITHNLGNPALAKCLKQYLPVLHSRQD